MSYIALPYISSVERYINHTAVNQRVICAVSRMHLQRYVIQ